MEKEKYPGALVFDDVDLDNLKDYNVVIKRNIKTPYIPHFNTKIELYEKDKEPIFLEINENSKPEDLKVIIDAFKRWKGPIEIKYVTDKEANEIRVKRLNNIFD